MRYLRELHAGDPVRVTFQLLGHDAKRMHYFEQLFHAYEGWMSATSENMTLHVDMTAKKVAPSQLNQSMDPGQFIVPGGAAGVAIAAAEREIGKPYVWGAAGPSSFDCSGLMLFAWAQAGVTLPHSSSAQSGMGVYVPLDQLQPGDLIFFGSPVHHVGMYVGNGDMIDAPNSGEDVKIQPIFSGARFGRRLAG